MAPGRRLGVPLSRPPFRKNVHISSWISDLPGLLEGTVEDAADRRTAPLFHYTTAGGLAGILKTGALHATHFGFLNDSSEGKHFREVAAGWVREKVAGLDASGANKPRTRALVEALLRELQPAPYFDHYVASLSEDGDLLSQWRGYGGAGSGYSIGFRRDALAEKADSGNYILAPCVYDEEQQRGLVDEFFRRVYRAVGDSWRSSAADNRLIVEAAGVALHWMIIVSGAFMKHPTFREEREWRLVQVRPSLRHLSDRGASLPKDARWSETELSEALGSIEHRITASGGVVPFVKLPVWESRDPDTDAEKVVCEVKIGPSAAPEERKDGVRLILFQEKLIDDVTITESKIPFRQV